MAAIEYCMHSTGLLHPDVDLDSSAFFAIVGYHFHLIAFNILRVPIAKVVVWVYLSTGILSKSPKSVVYVSILANFSPPTWGPGDVFWAGPVPNCTNF